MPQNPESLNQYVSALDAHGCQPSRSGSHYVAFCPVHEADGHGHNPSLTLTAGDVADVVMNCHAGCSFDSIRDALGLTPKLNGKRHITACYRYQDAQGRYQFEKVRYFPKDFRIRHQDATGAEVWKLPRGAEPALYRLPEVLQAIADGQTVFYVEGEKDVDRLFSAGLVATTNYEGAAKPDQKPKWRPSYGQALAGADVVLIPDNDPPGRAHMTHIAAQLSGVAKRVRVLELPDLPDHGDVSDWLRGHSVEELVALVTREPGSDDEPEAIQETVAPKRLLVPLSQFIGVPRPPCWRIRGILPASTIVQVFGDPSAGKSFLTVDWSCCVATGKDWFGHATKKGVAIYLAGEGHEGLRMRFSAWQQYRGMVSDESLYVSERPFRLDAEGASSVLAEIAAMPVKPDLVIVDTLATVMDGSLDENNTKDMNRFLDTLKRFIADSKATVIFNHHPGHGSKERGRGSSALPGGIDLSFRVVMDEFPNGKIIVTKPYKDGKPIAPLAYELRQVELPDSWCDPEFPDEPVTTCLFEVTGKAEPVSKTDLSPSERKARDALGESLMRFGQEHVEAPGVVSVDLEEFRKVFYELESGKTEEAQRKSFSRARNSLISNKIIESQKSRFWIPARNKTHEPF